MPKITLVISTKGRRLVLNRLFSSLSTQTLQDFSVILVDQNREDFLRAPLSKCERGVDYLHTPNETGISRGRNRGAREADSELLIFPDDDCWYPPDFLERAHALMSGKKLDALTGKPVDPAGNVRGRFETDPQWITRKNVWTTQIEWLAVWRRDMFEKVGGFDEEVGVGAETPWQSAEGQELMLRVLAAGGRAWYDPTLIGHDDGIDLEAVDGGLLRKVRGYGRGMGYVIRRHRLGFAPAATFLFRSFSGAALSALSGKISTARYYAATGVGRLEGLTGRCLGE